MSKLEKAYLKLQAMGYGSAGISAPCSPGMMVLSCVIYLAMMLSVPMGRLSMLIWFAIVPIFSCTWIGLSFGKIVLRSLYILPLLILIGIFNPVFDTETAITFDGIVISRGWVTFLSVIVRGLLALQSILILIEACGFTGICRGLRQLYLPAFLTDQIQFVYRYLGVLLLEALNMKRAREARGYGRKSYPIKLWGVMIGQLFLRAVDRAERINRAMEARGFKGIIPHYKETERPTGVAGWLYLTLVVGLSVFLRFFDLSTVFFR